MLLGLPSSSPLSLDVEFDQTATDVIIANIVCELARFLFPLMSPDFLSALVDPLIFSRAAGARYK